KTVIEDVTFCVKENECFGLLGPNGAGKSTIFNIIISNLKLTTGEIYFNGIDHCKSNNIIGYCSQTNVLWDELTVVDHIYLFLKLRGVQNDSLKDFTTYYVKLAQIEEHTNKKVKNISGGTKRKLAILLSIIAHPKQIILDEPTAGIDPGSRLIIWDLIKKVKKVGKSSLILTTHSMEEAQTLCDRITILINGRLVCIGSPEYLKMKYCSSYVLEVETRCHDQFHECLFGEDGMLSHSNYKLENVFNFRYKYTISINDTIGKIFKIMEVMKNKNFIMDYTLSQNTLEQVFIEFVKKKE
ncbi:P-loop containing nucleoside triphosphate hydrolase protein, partial [Neocallimastix californiae]